MHRRMNYIMNYIIDYGCALQKEILLQGRLYISEHHLCFNANIFGWITNVSRGWFQTFELTFFFLLVGNCVWRHWRYWKKANSHLYSKCYFNIYLLFKGIFNFLMPYIVFIFAFCSIFLPHSFHVIKPSTKWLTFGKLSILTDWLL